MVGETEKRIEAFCNGCYFLKLDLSGRVDCEVVGRSVQVKREGAGLCKDALVGAYRGIMNREGFTPERNSRLPVSLRYF